MVVKPVLELEQKKLFEPLGALRQYQLILTEGVGSEARSDKVKLDFVFFYII